jgi:uncharacterized membrane protein YdjX (TVP38/TMEM64 family)
MNYTKIWYILILLVIFGKYGDGYKHTLPKKPHLSMRNDRICLHATSQPITSPTTGIIESDSPETLGRDTLPQELYGHIVSDSTIWSIRRKIIRTSLIPILKNISSSTKSEDKKRDDDNMVNSSSNMSLLISSAVIAIGILLFRFGGRMAIIQVLGLDSIIDENARHQLDDIITYFQSLSLVQSYAAYFLLWFVTKGFFVDALGVALALSAGILFDGLLPGVTASLICSSLASLSVFLIARYQLRDLARDQIEKRPALRAIDRACATKGFQTVFTLRLSPVLPIPIGAYIYLYGASSVSIFDFLAGTTLGAIKPYLLGKLKMIISSWLIANSAV